jgi:hypothetical protein
MDSGRGLPGAQENRNGAEGVLRQEWEGVIDAGGLSWTHKLGKISSRVGKRSVRDPWWRPRMARGMLMSLSCGGRGPRGSSVFEKLGKSGSPVRGLVSRCAVSTVLGVRGYAPQMVMLRCLGHCCCGFGWYLIIKILGWSAVSWLLFGGLAPVRLGGASLSH